MYCFEKDSEIVINDIIRVDGKKFFKLRLVITVKNLDLLTQNWNTEKLLKNYLYFTKVDLSAITNEKVYQPREDEPISSKAKLDGTYMDYSVTTEK